MDNEVIDWVELMSITGEDISITKELLECFLMSINLDFSDLRLFLRRELRMEAEMKAHTIKGAAASIAAKKVRFLYIVGRENQKQVLHQALLQY
jgi:HPt (histidine-containing phosphotransfer) domain-containing protein